MRGALLVLCVFGLVAIARADTKPALVVSITAQGKIFVGGRLVEDKELDARFREVAAKDKDQPIAIEADKATPYGRVVEILDHAKAAGLTHIALATQKPPPPKK